MMSEFFMTFSIFGYIVGIYFYNSTKSNALIYVFSYISPTALVLCYYFNACFTHNLYRTFFGHGTTFMKRCKTYKIGAIFVVPVSVLMTFFSIKETIQTDYFIHSFYGKYFTLGLYVLGLFTFVYIWYRIHLVINRQYHYFGFFGVEEKEDDQNCKIF